MSPTSHCGDDHGTHMNAMCLLGCGLIASAPNSTAENITVEHFLKVHPEQKLFVQDVHFIICEAPFRCDTCNVVAEPPWWTRTVTPRLDIGDEDGRWLICDPCEQLFKVGDIEGVWQRWLTLAHEMAPHLAASDLIHKIKETSIENYEVLREGEVTGPDSNLT